MTVPPPTMHSSPPSVNITPTDLPSPPRSSSPNDDASTPSSSAASQQTCQNCFTSTTPLWRRDDNGAVLCNACGLFLKMKGKPRPISLKTDTIKSRNRAKGSNNSPPPQSAQQHVQQNVPLQHQHYSPGAVGAAGAAQMNGFSRPQGGISKEKKARKVSTHRKNASRLTPKSKYDLSSPPPTRKVSPQSHPLTLPLPQPSMYHNSPPPTLAPLHHIASFPTPPADREMSTMRARVTELEFINSLMKQRVAELEQQERAFQNRIYHLESALQSQGQNQNQNQNHSSFGSQDAARYVQNEINEMRKIERA